MLVAFIKKQKTQLISTQLEIVPQGSFQRVPCYFVQGPVSLIPSHSPLSFLSHFFFFSFTFHISNPFWLLSLS